jgi:hypothetical protein
MISASMDGGRPTDPLTNAFDGCMEGLVTAIDDRDVLDKLRGRLSQVRAMETRLLVQIERRIDRLTTSAIPEIRRIAQETDRALTARTEANR